MNEIIFGLETVSTILDYCIQYLYFPQQNKWRHQDLYYWPLLRTAWLTPLILCRDSMQTDLLKADFRNWVVPFQMNVGVFQLTKSGMLRLKKLHAWDNNSPEVQKDYAAEQHYSWLDCEADHRLLSPLTFTLIKDLTPLLNFPPHCFLMWGWHLAALVFHFDCCEKIWKMQSGKKNLHFYTRHDTGIYFESYLDFVKFRSYLIVLADDKDQQYICINTIANSKW